MLYNDNQLHHIHTYIIFSPSLLMTSCLGNIQWRGSPTALVSCCNSLFLNASCFTCHKWSFTLHVTHPSNWVSCLPHELRIESSISRALARQWSFAGAPFFVFRFISKFVCFARQGRSLCKRKLATGFDPSPSELVVALTFAYNFGKRCIHLRKLLDFHSFLLFNSKAQNLTNPLYNILKMFIQINPHL